MNKFNGKLISKIRKEKGISAERLAADSGISYSSIASIEQGVRKPKADTLNKIAQVLEVSMENFFE